MPTSFTFNKSPMSNSISVMTDTTRLGGISRINVNNSNPFSQSLIFNELLKFKERPLVNPFIISCRFSNSFQIFHDDDIATIQTINNIFTDIVITPSHEPSPASRDSFQLSLRSLCAFTLKNRNEFVMFDPQLFNIFTIEFPLGGNSNFIDPEVNAQNSVTMLRKLGIFPEECKSKIIFSFIFSKETFSQFQFIKILQSIIRNLNRDFNSSCDSRNTQNIIFERKTPRRIIPNGNFIYNWIRFGFFNKATSLFNAGYRKLRRQTKFSQLSINERMELDIISNIHSPSNINTMLKSLFIKFNSINNSFINFNFNRYTSQHGKISKDSNYLNILEDYGIPPNLKRSGILPNFR